MLNIKEHLSIQNFQFAEGEIININKPLTWTSFQVANFVKYIVKRTSTTKIKVGHAGTLDPLATGVLLVCTGKKTKTISDLQNMGKCYTGTIVIGATTPCFDLEQAIDNYYPIAHISDEDIHNATQPFIGEILQTPPIFSAAWVGGKRSYDLARAGKEVELAPRLITIQEFSITAIRRKETFIEADIFVRCGKGTYIRSLARDLGIALGSGAHLSALCRTAIGEFKIEYALSPDEFKAQVVAQFAMPVS